MAKIEYTNPVRHGLQWIVYYYFSGENDARRSNPFETREEAVKWVTNDGAKDKLASAYAGQDL